MELMQTQMFTMIQEIQKNVNEIYMDWKSNGGLSNHTESDTKWIEVKYILITNGILIILFNND